MAKQSPNNQIRQKAADMRAAQQKQDAKMRNVLIALVGIIVFAILISVVFLVINKPAADTGPDSLPESFEDGQPIMISQEGIMATEPSDDDLTFYFSYSCPACAQASQALAPNLVDGALEGKYTLALSPVPTSAPAFNEVATSGALLVAQESPDQFLDYHQAVEEFFLSALGTQDTSVLEDEARSLEAVQEVARQAGISDELVERISPASGRTYLSVSRQHWDAREVEGRTQLATPEFVYKDKQLTLEGETGAEAYESLLSQVN